MMDAGTSGNYDRLLAGLTERQEAALPRNSRTLESLIDALHATGERISMLEGDERPRALAEYARLRERAKKYRWYLEVQREAIGLRQHHGLDEFYAIPGPVDR